MAYLYLIQILSSNFGYKQYVHDHEKTSLLNFGFYRTNICRFLFKNVQVIANRLDSELQYEKEILSINNEILDIPDLINNKIRGRAQRFLYKSELIKNNNLYF